MANGRGSWNLIAAVQVIWDGNSLSNQFKTESDWSSYTSGEFLVFNDTEARPTKAQGSVHPRPYCVFEQAESVILGHSSGQTAETVKQEQDVPVQFKIYASTKTKAKQYAALVAAAFDRARLNLDDDKHIETFRDGDFPVREDDKTWAWVLSYRFRIDCTYSAALS